MEGKEITLRGQPLAAAGRRLRRQAAILGTFVALMWALEIVDTLLLGGALDGLGIQPRTVTGLRGIPLMPLLHNGLGHLLANTVPFLVLGWLVMLRHRGEFFVVSAVVILVSGLGVWLFGGGRTVHIGASGLVFGYFGYLLLRAYFERSLLAILLAAVVILFYGGFVWGIVPLRMGISWQAHFFGFLGGVLAAYVITRANGWQRDSSTS
jgi:membrane associated rhomboid family serine protease